MIPIIALVLAVGVFKFLRMPAAMGYLLAGLAIGPHGSGLFVAGDDTRFLAELGLVFLMLMVGLEFSLPRLLGLAD
ncbi:cation:proton antiporter [Cognatilysobacter terrigena]|uniref:cation:proton antiporter domain-containing protein n=1 Tax=Cognatilysobacter terrigena TaxID=2488749 RepID=UPI001AADC152|nr:cation:proton antiporter [Lysobacter terrigena]